MLWVCVAFSGVLADFSTVELFTVCNPICGALYLYSAWSAAGRFVCVMNEEEAYDKSALSSPICLQVESVSLQKGKTVIITNKLIVIWFHTNEGI